MESTTSQLDNLAAGNCCFYDYEASWLCCACARIAVSNLHKNTKNRSAKRWKDLYEYIDRKQATGISYCRWCFLRSCGKTATCWTAPSFTTAISLWLFWIQNAGEIIPSQDRWKSCRASRTHDHARGCRIIKTILNLSLKLTTWWVSAGLRTHSYSLQCRNTKSHSFHLVSYCNAGRQHWRNL